MGISEATNLWCSITNALIMKYKFMAEENTDEAIKQLKELRSVLLENGFLTEKDLERAL